MAFSIILADCFEWLKECPANAFHAVITDPPFGIREFTRRELDKMKAGRGGVWRIPPSIGGSQRAPLPRFTGLTPADIDNMRSFFYDWSKLTLPVLVPGGHIFIAATPLWSHVVFDALTEAGFEKRGEIVRLVRTLRGGDRPKGAETEFPDVSAMPRSCWEPWGLFRRPFNGTLAENLRRWSTGGLRRLPDGNPFPDVIESIRTPRCEREIAPHPSLKPQQFMRQLVWASLPLGQGKILDPFAGAGSTLAAAEALGYDSVGIEINEEYVQIARRAVLELAKLVVNNNQTEQTKIDEPKSQLSLPLFENLNH
ncbi:site-specific DNA-methyltransferase [Candidatus Poribacteria bacterium]|nr:site-specific DNA-methyltransferase [Candidatus Poribacteria bacterium]